MISVMQKFALFIFCLIFSSLAFSKSLCPNGQYFVSGHHRKSYVRANGVSVSAATVKAHCKPYTKAYEVWNSKFKNEPLKNWPHKTETFKKWTEEEKERLLEVFEDLPEELWSRSTQGIYRSSKSREFPNPATSAEGVIVLYDSAFKDKANLS